MKITIEMLKGVTVLDDSREYLPKGVAREDVTEVEIPNSVTEIGGYAFKDCHMLKSVTIPNSIKKIEKQAFDWSDNLKMFIVPKDFNVTNKEVYEMLKTEYPSVKIVYKK